MNATERLHAKLAENAAAIAEVQPEAARVLAAESFRLYRLWHEAQFYAELTRMKVNSGWPHEARLYARSAANAGGRLLFRLTPSLWMDEVFSPFAEVAQ